MFLFSTEYRACPSGGKQVGMYATGRINQK